jgi:Fibronectin type III domain
LAEQRTENPRVGGSIPPPAIPHFQRENAPFFPLKSRESENRESAAHSRRMAMTMLPQLREDRPGRSSDHKPFISRSVPGVRFIDVNEKPSHQHSPNDLFIYVTPAFTARVTEVVVASAASLSRAPTPPLNMIATGISSSTVQLAWSPPASGSAVDHYVISARTSAENFYRTRMVVSGGLTSATADVFQDLGIPPATAYYVSIAAVDAAGHESLYAYPEYRCDSTNTCSQPADALNVTATK